MTEGETFVLVALDPNLDPGTIEIVDGAVRFLTDDGRGWVQIGMALELEADIEYETAAEPGDASTGRWRNRFLGPWRTGSKPWEEVKNRD